MRKAEISRTTTETALEVKLDLDGTGAYAQLRGHGDFCVFPVGDRFRETFTGTFTLG